MYLKKGMDLDARGALLDAVAGPVFYVDRDYRYLAFNEANRRVVRDLYGTDLTVGASLLESVTVPEDRDALRFCLDRSLAGETHSDGSWYGRDPHRRFFTVTYAPVVRDEGVVGVAAVAVDTTDLLGARSELEAANRELIREREFARTLLDTIEDCVVACDAEGRPVLMNRAARETRGLHTCADLPAEADAGSVTAGVDGVSPLRPDDLPLARALRGEHPHDQLFTIRREGAPPRTVMASGDRFSDAAGEKLGAVVVFRDVTERQAAAEALRLSEEKFEAAFRASPDAININRLSDGLYLEVNDGFTALTGYTPEDVAGKTSIELSVWDDPADRNTLVAELLSDRRVDRLEAQFRRKDGTVRAGEMSARIIDIGGELCILSVTTDISARKRVQADLEASYARLEHMSHDMVQTLGRVVEARDPYTQGHEERAAELCRLIATRMGMSESDVAALETAALVHDIGKMGIPAELLTKPGRLSPTEYNLIMEHPKNSFEILKGIAFGWPIAEVVLQHHERMDGSGYPRGLHGEEIRLLARVLAVADVVEAMATHRPYRAALGLDAAIEELRTHPEKYDRDVVAAFLELCDGGCVVL